MQRRLDDRPRRSLELRRLRLRRGQRRAGGDRRPPAGDHRGRAIADAPDEAVAEGILELPDVKPARGIHRSKADYGTDRARRVRRHRRLQGGRNRPRAAEAGPRRGRDHDAVGEALRRSADASRRSRAARSSPISGSPAPTPTSSTSRWPRLPICCWSRRRPRTSIGKFANGIADDFLSSLYLATTAPVLMAPAMNTNMFAHPAVVRESRDAGGARRDVRRAGRGLSGVRLDRQGPARRAGGRRGRGAARAARRRARLPGGACWSPPGPTLEDIDPVRFVGNRSSGRMGYAIAAEAARRGARVTLVSGPTKSDRAAHRRALVQVRSAAEMHAGGAGASRGARRRDHGRRGGRLHRGDAGGAEDREAAMARWSLTLTRTRDILGDLGRCRRAAARSSCPDRLRGRDARLMAHAAEKLERKGVDLIVANDVSQPGVGFDADDQRGHAGVARRASSRCRCSPSPRSRPGSSIASNSSLRHASRRCHPHHG